MKGIKLFIFITLLLFHHCKSEEMELMWYTDVDPDQSSTSMIPFPWTFKSLEENSVLWYSQTGYNSTISYAMTWLSYDFFNDGGENEFDFQVYHNFEEDQVLPNTAMIFMGSRKDRMVSLSDKSKRYIKQYSYGDVLDYESFGANSEDQQVQFLIKKDAEDNLDCNGEFYIAVKRIINSKPHYGWFRVQVESASLTLTVKEFALCRNAKQKITVGQRN